MIQVLSLVPLVVVRLMVSWSADVTSEKSFVLLGFHLGVGPVTRLL